MPAWWKDKDLRFVVLLGVGLGVLYKALLWHWYFGLSVSELVDKTGLGAYIFQYITGGGLGGVSAYIGGLYARRGR